MKSAKEYAVNRVEYFAKKVEQCEGSTSDEMESAAIIYKEQLELWEGYLSLFYENETLRGFLSEIAELDENDTDMYIVGSYKVIIKRARNLLKNDTKSE